MCYTGMCRYEGYDGECDLDKGVIPPDDSECAKVDRYEEQAREYKNKMAHRRNLANKNIYLIKRIQEAGL